MGPPPFAEYDQFFHEILAFFFLQFFCSKLLERNAPLIGFIWVITIPMPGASLLHVFLPKY